jgi:hypothetical protein
VFDVEGRSEVWNRLEGDQGMIPGQMLAVMTAALKYGSYHGLGC